MTYAEPDPEAGWPQQLTATMPVWTGDHPVTNEMFVHAQRMWLREVEDRGYESKTLPRVNLVDGIHVPDHPHRGPDMIVVSGPVAPMGLP